MSKKLLIVYIAVYIIFVICVVADVFLQVDCMKDWHWFCFGIYTFGVVDEIVNYITLKKQNEMIYENEKGTENGN